MAQDPYTTLGVSRTANSDEIRKAFRELAKKFHPDRNPDNKAAEDRFKAVSAAFEIIGDTAKRAKFDRGELDADGNERAAGGPFGPGGAAKWQRRGGAGAAHGQHGFDDISDIFGDFFGQKGGQRGPRPQKGADIRYRLSVNFLDAALGATKRVALQEGRHIDVAIPQGLRDGQTLRLRGQGSQGIAGGPAGDVFVEISVTPHPFFTTKGDDITVDVPITLKEAVLGAKIDVPTLESSVAIKIPANTSSGISFRLRGKGLKDPKSGKFGDLYARTKIIVPEKSDEALAKFMESWTFAQPDPRSAQKA